MCVLIFDNVRELGKGIYPRKQRAVESAAGQEGVLLAGLQG